MPAGADLLAPPALMWIWARHVKGRAVGGRAGRGPCRGVGAAGTVQRVPAPVPAWPLPVPEGQGRAEAVALLPLCITGNRRSAARRSDRHAGACRRARSRTWR